MTKRPDNWGDLQRPTVRVEMRPIYIVSWQFWGNYDLDSDGHPTIDHLCTHTSRYIGGRGNQGKRAAYLHAARGFIVAKRRDRGCTTLRDQGECKFGTHEWDAFGQNETDTRCKYCRFETAERIAKRLARWLMWRDARLAALKDSPRESATTEEDR